MIAHALVHGMAIVVATVCVVLPVYASNPGVPLEPHPIEGADPGMLEGIEHGRRVYGQALEEQDPVRRARLFAEAERTLREAAAVRPTPELVTDWGNAALGAGDSGRATLAFRRALALQPNHERAAKNLAWLRDRAPSWLPRPASGGRAGLPAVLARLVVGLAALLDCGRCVCPRGAAVDAVADATDAPVAAAVRCADRRVGGGVRISPVVRACVSRRRGGD